MDVFALRFLRLCMRLAGQSRLRVERHGSHLPLALRLAIGPALLLTAALLVVLAVVLLVLGH